MQLFLQPSLLRRIFLPSRILAPVSVIASRLLPNPVCIRGLILTQFFAIAIPFIRCQHRIQPDRHPDLFPVILMAVDCHTDGSFNLYLVFLREQLDIELALVLVSVCQRHKNTFPLFLDGNVNPTVPIPVRPFRYRKPVRPVRMELHMVFAHLPAQIFVQPLCIHLRSHFFVLLLHGSGQFDWFLVQYLFKSIVHLEQKAEIVFLLLVKPFILVQ